MKYTLISVGSRGDIEPFLAIAVMLKENGHNAHCVMPKQFRVLAEESGLIFHSMGSEFIDMLCSDAGKKAMGGGVNGFQKIWYQQNGRRFYSYYNSLSSQ